MDQRLRELRETYSNRGFIKKGVSLRLLVEHEGVLTEAQHGELRDYHGISTIEEFYEAFHSETGLKDKDEAAGGIALTSKEQLGIVAATIEKYLTPEERKLYKTQRPKFNTGALNPNEEVD